MESPITAERLMTPTADGRGGSRLMDPPRGGFFCRRRRWKRGPPGKLQRVARASARAIGRDSRRDLRCRCLKISKARVAARAVWRPGRKDSRRNWVSNSITEAIASIATVIPAISTASSEPQSGHRRGATRVKDQFQDAFVVEVKNLLPAIRSLRATLARAPATNF
jgi:hypothetical protein